MKFTRLIISLFALLLLLPINVAAQDINVYPGPLLDEYGEPIINPVNGNWIYLYDYGEVKVGTSAVMIFEIQNDPTSTDDLEVENVYLEDGTGPFEITDSLSFPRGVVAGESIYVEVTFTPNAEGFFEDVMRILTNASNIPPGQSIPYGLQGVGIEGPPDPSELMSDVIDYYNEQINIGQIVGLGPGNSGNSKERIFGKMLDDISDLIVAGDYSGACRSLNKAILRIDGQLQPPDMLSGPALDTLHSMLLGVMNALDC